MEGLDRGETQASGHHWADLEKKKANLLSALRKRKKIVLEINAVQRQASSVLSFNSHEMQITITDLPYSTYFTLFVIISIVLKLISAGCSSRSCEKVLVSFLISQSCFRS